MRRTRVWARLLGLQRAVVEDVPIGDEEELIVAVRPSWRERDRCGECRRRSPGFDLGDGRRRWRALDLGSTEAFLEAEAPRVTCHRHGVVVCWAAPASAALFTFSVAHIDAELADAALEMMRRNMSADVQRVVACRF